MRATSRFILGSAVVSVACLAGVPAANAVCDPYSGVCVDDETVVVGEGGGVLDGNVEAGAGTGQGAADGSNLPRTGGELALLSALGVVALGGGTALVVAGRRRRTETA